jgi:hypothetical protein
MKSKANGQITREVQTVFKRYGVKEYRVDYVPSDKRTVMNFTRGLPEFRMQVALMGLDRAIKLSMGE